MDRISGVGRTLGQVQMACRIINPTRGLQRDIPFMKRQTDMPSEQKMLFFTPELYLRFNSRDTETALAADAEWEAAIVRYHEHLATLSDKMPSQVTEL